MVAMVFGERWNGGGIRLYLYRETYCISFAFFASPDGAASGRDGILVNRAEPYEQRLSQK